ncbi:60S acidic ribosomal protein P1-alpha [[Candida] jaroonii]|uniref:60S acidic ribosomal protein P1-alpha n=1 Tax=[Candida] jaroonii TaxID=467808 RepID=A0ACA9Y538_9ASCO|nr:60S acidic ribosomal protein P1-alpha [[Candida] jaroonii]
MSVETPLSYAALILSDSDIEISSENLLTLVRKANIEIEDIWADIFSKALSGQNLKDLFFNISSGPAAPAAAGAAATGGAAEEAAAEEEEEEKEESDDDMGFGLFD